MPELALAVGCPVRIGIRNRVSWRKYVCVRRRYFSARRAHFSVDVGREVVTVFRGFWVRGDCMLDEFSSPRGALKQKNHPENSNY